jgi:transcriptional regulator with XRE-family HTH domain
MKTNGLTESEFAEYFRSLCARRGNQAEMASRLGVSAVTVSDVLAGKRNLGSGPLAKLGFRKVSVYVRLEENG